MNRNGLMTELLSGDKSELSPLSPKNRTAAEKRIDKLFRDVAFEHGCLFLRTHNGKAQPENCRDKVEFEAWHNEILINSEFPKMRVTAAFALLFFERFNARLTSVFPKKICSVLSEDDGRWTFRFHIVREGEPLWISEDLEKFSQPILYDIFGGE